MNRDLPRYTLPALCAGLVALTLAVFWPVRGFEFVNFDDPDYVSANAMVQAGLTRDSVLWAFTKMHSSNWHPLTWLSHMLDCQMLGLNAGAHHLVNAAFHAANAALLLALLVRLTGTVGRSVVVAGLFALHPLHVESVAWIAERKDVLSAFFGLLTLLAYVGYVRRLGSGPDGRTWNWSAAGAYAVALVCFALGLMSKPMLVTWPCVMLLLDYWPLRRFAWSANGAKSNEASGAASAVCSVRWLFMEKLPFLALTVASSVITVIVQGRSGATVPLDALPLEVRLAQAAVSYLRYLGKTFWPEGLAAFYPYAPMDWGNPAALAGLGLVLGVSLWALWQLRRHPWFAVGWFWFLGTLVPVIGLVQVGRQSLADRYTYLPHIGLFVAMVWLVAEGLERFRLRRMARAAFAAVVLVACGMATTRQLGHWRNTLTLATHAAEVTTGNFVAHAQLAAALTAAGKLEDALDHCREALRIKPDYAEAHQVLGSIRVREGNFEEAVTSFREAARCDTTFPDPHHALADAHFKQGRFIEAEEASREALRLWPLHLGVRYLLAASLHSQGRLNEAIAEYRALDALKPKLFSVHRGLGSALVAQGDLPAAEMEYQRALEIQPQNADALNALGLILLAQGEITSASNQFSRVLATHPTNAIAHYQIALLLTAACQPAQAVEHYQAVLLARPDMPEALNNLAWLRAASADTSIRDGPEAVRLAERACELTEHKEPLLVGTLAAAYAEAGRFAEAVAAAEKAITLAEAAELKDIAARNRELLALYQSGRAFHEPP